jgi:hypothetical protein
MDRRLLYEIWESPDQVIGRWRAQMVNYVAHFETREQAESFVAATKRAREQDAKSVVKTSK